MKRNAIKDTLLKGKTVFGPFCKIQDPTMIEIAALAGFDFVILDMEHGPFSIESVQNLIRAAEAKGITPIVRVTENSDSLILRTLDVGAKCIQVPQISSKKDAEYVVKASKFYPNGERGMCRYVRAAEYTNIDANTHFSSANNQVITIIHIEGLEGIENLSEILSVEGIDVIFLGPYDLSQSCGVPGQVHHEKVITKMKDAVALAKAHGKFVGTFTESVEDAKQWQNIGVQYIAYAVDVGLVMNAYKTITNKIKN
ncbi:MAG: aldolase/citrate lyase family protein [Algibacter sp.]|uniref:HpcH/HpaI aldolase family protein n=1 Tax=Algibacter sp. TaxID=1872428 RepID=UPI002625CB72|nr:aldolase/citrate lyase family protein [Algibacter sp.]MDG1731260.1 aldolase/citrate lyase family protein [Algibacter sp.]MDG2178799.1 aldolase/citrate lyase family protein [Algibacter sp.]